jgi:hypothetical protein
MTNNRTSIYKKRHFVFNFFLSPITILVLLIITTSCQKDNNLDTSNNSSAIIRLCVSPGGVELPNTKASVNESKVSNLHIIVFNNSGNVVGQTYSSTADTVVNVQTRQGNGYTIYAIANTGDPSFFSGVTTLNAFQSKMTSLDINNHFIMSGSLINQNINSNSMSVGGLTLTRVFAKITLNVTAVSGITVTGYKFGNIPAYTYLVDKGTDALNGWSSQSQITTSSINNTSFYMYENRAGTNTACTSSKLRNTTNAPANASYVDIYATGDGGLYNTTYRVYLGNNNTSDFNVNRNYSYTYSINLNYDQYLNGDSGTDARVSVSIIGAAIQSTSNCYMVKPGGNIIGIPISRANEDGTIRLSNLSNGWTSGFLWTDNSYGFSTNGPVAKVKSDYANKRIIVVTGNTEGNAIVYVKDASGNIAWSWHIWVTNYDPNTTYEYFNGYTWMDRHLGAFATATSTSDNTYSKCGGLYYQWGRKDPFPKSNTIDNYGVPIYGFSIPDYSKDNLTIIDTNTSYLKEADASTAPISYANQLFYSVRHPLLYFINWGGSKGIISPSYTSNGGMSSWSGEFGESKSVYDPCPVGWRIPSGRKLSSTWVSPWDGCIPASPTGLITSNYIATPWRTTTSSFYPAQGGISKEGYFRLGLSSYVWSACRLNTGGLSFHINFNYNADSGFESSSTYAFPVRCVKI